MDGLTRAGDLLGLRPSTVTLPSYAVLSVLLIAAAIVWVPELWRVFRLVVTLVHELGHATVGALCGRRFTGFVIGGDGSGHAVTVGRSRGLGRVLTTWAGYPMPALVGGLFVWAGTRGWSRPMLAALLVGLVLTLVRIRSALTLLVLVACAVGTGWLWWSGSGRAQAEVLVGVGVLLLVGAWRHLLSVWRAGRRVDDPQVLAQLTHIPATLWLVSWLLVCALVSWAAIGALAAAVR